MRLTFVREMLRSRLAEFHGRLGAELPGLLRIAVTIGDAPQGTVRLFVHDGATSPPFTEHALPQGEHVLPGPLDAALKTGALLTRFRDRETAGHVERVGRASRVLAAAVAERWGLSDEVIEAVSLFAMAHDIGKLAVPEGLLGKHGPLDLVELARMKSHTTAGAAMVEGMVSELGLAEDAQMSILRRIVRSHHERLDGSGYPDGLSGDAIPAEARLVAVADVYDSLRSARAYKEAWSEDEALAYLKAESGSRLDPEAVEAAVTRSGELEKAWRGEET